MKTHSIKLLALQVALIASANALTIVDDPNNPNGYLLSRAELNAARDAKASYPMYQNWAKALETRDNSIVEAITPNNASNPENVKRVERVFGQQEWDFLTGMAAPEYTYTRFLRAIGKFPAFCGEYTDGRDSDAICKKSIITAFAHFAQETGGHIAKDNISDNPLQLEEWQQALVHVREMGWSKGRPVIQQGVVKMIGKIAVGHAQKDKVISAAVRSSCIILIMVHFRK